MYKPTTKQEKLAQFYRWYLYKKDNALPGDTITDYGLDVCFTAWRLENTQSDDSDDSSLYSGARELMHSRMEIMVCGRLFKSANSELHPFGGKRRYETEQARHKCHLNKKRVAFARMHLDELEAMLDYRSQTREIERLRNRIRLDTEQSLEDQYLIHRLMLTIIKNGGDITNIIEQDDAEDFIEGVILYHTEAIKHLDSNKEMG